MKKLLTELQEIKKLLQVIVSNLEQQKPKGTLLTFDGKEVLNATQVYQKHSDS